VEALTLCHLPLQTTSETEIEVVGIAILVVVYGIDLRWRIVPAVDRKPILGVVVIEKDISIELCPIALTPSIRVAYGKYLGRSDTRLAIYRE
jgi:hypothetical protein